MKKKISFEGNLKRIIMENESRRSSEIRRVSCQENRETAEERNALWSTLFVKRNFLASSKLKWPKGSFSRGAKYQILSCAMLQMGSPRATGICSPSVCLSLHFTYFFYGTNLIFKVLPANLPGFESFSLI